VTEQQPHLGDEALTDLALGQVDERLRDGLTRHLGGCETCRSRYAEIADAVEHVLVAAPRVEPPAGFSQRVLVATGLGGSVQTMRPARVRRHHGPSRRTALLVAAALVVGIGVGAAGSAVVGRGTSTQQVAVGAPLRTAAGDAVGSVQRSWSDAGQVLVVSVSGGRAGERYSCWLVLADGSRQAAGTWALDGSGGGSWVVPWPPTGQVRSVEMVSDSGVRWATAQV